MIVNRMLAFGAVVGAAVLLAILMFGAAATDYRLNAQFLNAASRSGP